VFRVVTRRCVFRARGDTETCGVCVVSVWCVRRDRTFGSYCGVPMCTDVYRCVPMCARASPERRRCDEGLGVDGLDGWRARTDGWRAREDGRRWATRHTTTPLIDAMATHTSLTMRASVAARPTTWSGKTTTTTRRARGAVHVLGAASKAKKNRDLDRLRDLATAEETLLVAGFNYQGLTVRKRVARERENARTRHGWAASDDGRGRRAKTEPRGRTEGRPRARRGEGG